jgi:lipid-A-disaccharide synthase-like uncharacterized protein
MPGDLLTDGPGGRSAIVHDFAYALTIKDPVFILGQGFGVFVYARNLYFVYRERRMSGLTAA